MEVLMLSGRDILHSMTMLVPPAWRSDEKMDPDLKAYYEYHRCFIEPWDGPAGLIFSNGIVVAACLDRNGLRPARYKITEDGLVSLGSEVGPTKSTTQRLSRKGDWRPAR